MVDEIFQDGLLRTREKEDYVCKFPNNYFRMAKLIKLMIKENRCTQFVNTIRHMDCCRHVIEHIMEARQKAERGDRCGTTGNCAYMYK